MHRHVITVFVILHVVVLLVTMHYLVLNLRVKQRILPLLKDWELKKVFQCKRQRGEWMPISFSMSSQSGGCRACRGPTSSIGCSAMPPHRVRKNTIGPSAGIGDSPPPNGIWRQKLPPWTSSDPGCFKWICRPSIMMCTSWGGCQVKALVTKQWLRKSEGPSWNLSRSPLVWAEMCPIARTVGFHQCSEVQPPHQSSSWGPWHVSTYGGRFIWGGPGSGTRCALPDIHGSMPPGGSDWVAELTGPLQMIPQPWTVGQPLIPPQLMILLSWPL